jgi:hypothetical protein
MKQQRPPSPRRAYQLPEELTTCLSLLIGQTHLQSQKIRQTLTIYIKYMHVRILKPVSDTRFSVCYFLSGALVPLNYRGKSLHTDVEGNQGP